MHPSDDFADLIEPFSRRGVDLGLDRLQAALAELDHPERRFEAVQVAGTNGKGSICTLVHQGLLAAGIDAGLYTSPHLVSWCERIRLGDTCIAPQDLRRHLQTVRPIALELALTPFELVTAAAFLAFAEAELPLVVLEVGLGGRLDATTCHPHRPVIGLASIGLDHLEFLGPNLASIAAEKAGVLQQGGVAISGPQVPEVAAVLAAQATAVGAQLRWVDPLPQNAAGDLRLAAAGSDEFDESDQFDQSDQIDRSDQGQWSPCGLAGAVQASNAAVAQGVLLALAQRGWPIDAAAIRRGVAAARWPGRLQQLTWCGVPLLIDGAHNPPAAAALRAELDAHPERHGLAPGPRRWVIGMLANKQGPEILEALLAPGDQAWIVPVPGHTSWSRDQLAAQLAARPCAMQLGATQLRAMLIQAPDLPQALAAAASPGPRRVVVAGSLYLVGSLLAQPLPDH
jgi:dihydrofolate synthase / folylpolyglutamate synthase